MTIAQQSSRFPPPSFEGAQNFTVAAPGGIAANSLYTVGPSVASGIYTSTAGSLTLVMVDGSTATFAGIQAGSVIPVRHVGISAAVTIVGSNCTVLY